MPVPVKCPDCAASLKAPDKARGKALKCPKCGGRIKVPAAPSKPKPAAKAAPDTGEFLAGVDLSRVEDTQTDVCPKCGTVVTEEDIECPKCGADLLTGGKGQTLRRKEKFKSRGEDPRVYYKKAPGDAWAFLKKNVDVAVRLGVLASFAAVAAGGCGLMVKYCAYVPPKMFWGGLAVVGALFLPGCLWVLQEAVTELTFRGKQKFKRFRFDTLLCVARGPRIAGWAMVALFPLTILDVAAWAGVAVLGMPPAVAYAALAAHAAALFLCWPAGLGHMAMPVSGPGWNFAVVAKGTLANLGPVLFWAVLTLAAFVPFLAAVGGVWFYAGGEVAELLNTLDQNNAVARGESEAGTADVDWKALIVPAAALAPCAFLFAFGAVYASRPAGLLAKTFRPSLGLITMTKEKKYVSTTRKKDEFGDFIDGDEEDELDLKKVVLIVLGGVPAGLVIGALAIPSFDDTVGRLAGAGLGVMMVSWLSGLAANFVLMAQAFKESVLWGLAYLFVPLASLFFIVKHWDKAQYPFFWTVGAALTAMLGLGLAIYAGFDSAQMTG